MLIYLVSFALTLVITKLCEKTPLYRCKRFLVISLISMTPLFLVAAFRYGIGVDYFEYRELFYICNNSKKGIFDYDIEPLFVLFNRAIGAFTNDYLWFFIISSFIFLLLVFYSIFKESTDPTISVFLFVSMTFYFSFFNTTRQLLACAFLLLSILFLIKKKPFFFLLFVCVAGFIHYSCFVFLIVFIFDRINIKPKVYIFLTILFFVFSPFVRNLIFNFTSSTKYVEYLSKTTEYSLASFLGIIIQSIIFIFALFYRDDSKKYRFFCNIQMISLWICVLGGAVPLINRIKWIFFLPSIFLIPMALKNINNSKEKTFVKASLIVSFLAYAFVVIYITGSYGVYPYQSIFDI